MKKFSLGHLLPLLYTTCCCFHQFEGVHSFISCDHKIHSSHSCTSHNYHHHHHHHHHRQQTKRKWNGPLFAIKKGSVMNINSTFATGGNLNGLPTSTTTTTTPSRKSTPTTWKEKLLQISNVASLLCVIDCTVLPIMMLLLPLIGIGASAAQAKFLHELGHSIAIFFVLPVGGLASTMNYLSHRNAFVSSLGALGLSLIYLTNGEGGPILSLLPHHIRHTLHCGTIIHKLCNITGCMLLFGSNLISHRIMKGCAYGAFNNLTWNKKHMKNRIVGFCCNLPGCKNKFGDQESQVFFSWN